MTKEELIESWIKSRVITNKKLLDTFKKVNREQFVPEEYKKYAYDDRALPLRYESTISQPTTIMIMIQALEIKNTHKVLEIGTGSGYTAALLSQLAKKVYSVEIIPELTKQAKENLNKEKITNVKLYCRDGSKGLQEHAPFDRILINAACEHVPLILFKQLKNNGILIAPVGTHQQHMIKYTKTKEKITEKYLGEFSFVKLQKN